MTMRSLITAVLVTLVATPVLAVCPGSDAVAAPGIDLEKGRRAFLKCRACHSVAQGDKNLVGPNLWNVFTRPALGATGFSYSPAFSAARISWDAASINSFIEKPSKHVAGTRMIFAGIADPLERANVIAWLAGATGCSGAAK
ncbi:MAG: c-type cytochrome [Polymorphobacter sp.]